MTFWNIIYLVCQKLVIYWVRSVDLTDCSTLPYVSDTSTEPISDEYLLSIRTDFPVTVSLSYEPGVFVGTLNFAIFELSTISYRPKTSRLVTIGVAAILA